MGTESRLEALELLTASRWVRWACASVLIAVGFFALRTLLISGGSLLGMFDEAILLVNGEALHRGMIPFRDFASNYPPGIFQVMRGIIASGLPPIWASRIVGLLIRMVTAVLVARLAGQARGRKWCWSAGAAAIAFQSGLQLVPFAYTLAVAQLLFLMVLWVEKPDRRWVAAASGVMLGVLSYVRHDVVVYLGATLSGVEILCLGLWKRPFLFRSGHAYVEMLGAALIVAGVLWIPVFVQAGVTRVVYDLVFDVSRLAMPARVLPFPPLVTWVPVENLGMALPIVPQTKDSVTYAVWLGGLLLSALALGRKAWRRELHPDSRALWLLVIGTVTTLPAAMGRSDYYHIVYGVPYVFALAAALAPGWTRYGWDVGVTAAALVFAVHGGRIQVRPASWALWPHHDDEYRRPELAMLAKLVQEQVPEEEPIFVGCDSHARHIFSAMDVYYFCDRPGATRYMQFDPGLTTSAGVHQQMIADLDYSLALVFVQHRNCMWYEPNASQEFGSTLLDDYLRQHYVPVHQFPTYVVWYRKPASDVSYASR